ncbi:MAG: four helix bundle protein [Patescibacteria group bacterium]|jgi:four helix bundle protein
MVEGYKNGLKIKLDGFAHLVYRNTKSFPKDELYGITSQLRRATVSVVLNYIEGYARMKKLVQLNFLEISYGSLKETKYLLHFSWKENYLTDKNYSQLIKLAEEIGAMLWTEIQALRKTS